MADRGFDELDLREMLDDATSVRPARIAGRWVVETRHDRQLWEIIVEPDPTERVLGVITAYGID